LAKAKSSEIRSTYEKSRNIFRDEGDESKWERR
jgi:hypothetical protein